jgi:hypothetical protein
LIEEGERIKNRENVSLESVTNVATKTTEKLAEKLEESDAAR